MKVTLAVPYDGKAPDSTVDLPYGIAADLLHTGRARLPEADKAPAKTAAPKAADTK